MNINFGKPWSNQENALLFSDLTSEQIAKKLDRTVIAVRKQRYLITGHYVELAKHRYSEGGEAVSYNSEEYKILHIKALAKKLGVKLYED